VRACASVCVCVGVCVRVCIYMENRTKLMFFFKRAMCV